MDKQNGMYFTLWYGVFNTETRELAYSSGGHPPAILVADEQYQKLKTNGIVIGGMPDAKFESKTISVPNNAKLYVFSDGVYEVEYADGSGMMNLDIFAEELLKAPVADNTKTQSMMMFSQQAQKNEQFEDDFSLCEITIR
jgi:sigma-B regulation protein RsbU (phosphoserine phosphatase)